MSTGENRVKKDRIKENRIKENKRKSEHSRRRRNISAYVLGTLGLVLLVTAAFFGPKLVFAVQDDIRCGRVVNMSPEEVDITTFNTGYEMNLYKRLERFAKGLAEGREYYVTVQDMELTTEVADWAVSEQGFYQDSIQMLVWNLGLIPEEVFSYNLIRWKRCVIYGDDFAGGVNFILWYIEIGNNDKPVVRLLVDGETGELYGIRTNFDALFQDEEGEILATETLVDLYGIYDDNMWELSILLGDRCCGLEIGDMLSWLSYIGGEFYQVDDTLYVEVPNNYEYIQREWEQAASSVGNQLGYDWMEKYSVEQIQDFIQRLQWRVSEEGKCMDFNFPYKESSLNFRIRLDGEIRLVKEWTSSRYMDITFGFPEIYEKISVFMEDWD